MIVLGLDTTGPDCSVSLVDDAVVRAHISQNIGRGHAEVLAGFVEAAFQSAGLKPTDIDRLAVCTGPGSFTGLRVALSFAKGFTLPRNLPVIGIDALAITAAAHISDGSKDVAVFRDVRRGEVFYGEFLNAVPKLPVQAMLREQMDMRASAGNLQPIEAAKIDTRILAWLAMDLDPSASPAEPLYSRGPDAKLPGGKIPPPAKA